MKLIKIENIPSNQSCVATTYQTSMPGTKVWFLIQRFTIQVNRVGRRKMTIGNDSGLFCQKQASLVLNLFTVNVKVDVLGAAAAKRHF